VKKILFFGGKGGVGKTTSSCSCAYYFSNNNLKTLLISTDPAHSVGDLLNVKLDSSIKKIKENLYGLEIDPQTERDKYINRIKSNISKTISPVILKEIQRQLDAASISPGSEESAIFDKLIEIIIEESNNFDRIVFDTAPTGHTLRLMSLPELLESWLETLIKKRKKALKLNNMASNLEKKDIDDPIINILQKRKDKLIKARTILIDNNLASFVFVLNPEKLPILETKKSIEIMKKYNMNIENIVINKILPKDSNSDFLNKRREIQDKYLDEIEVTFKNINLIKIPLLDRDIDSEYIKEISNYFSF
jgi:arsenite-transporting ATPase